MYPLCRLGTVRGRKPGLSHVQKAQELELNVYTRRCSTSESGYWWVSSRSGLGPPCLTCDKPRPKSELVAALGKVATAGFSPSDTFEHRAHYPVQDVPQLTKSDQLSLHIINLIHLLLLPPPDLNFVLTAGADAGQRLPPWSSLPANLPATAPPYSSSILPAPTTS